MLSKVCVNLSLFILLTVSNIWGLGLNSTAIESNATGANENADPCGGFLKGPFGSLTYLHTEAESACCVWTVHVVGAKLFSVTFKDVWLASNESLLSLAYTEYNTHESWKWISVKQENKPIYVPSTEFMLVHLLLPKQQAGQGFSLEYEIIGEPVTSNFIFNSYLVTNEAAFYTYPPNKSSYDSNERTILLIQPTAADALVNGRKTKNFPDGSILMNFFRLDIDGSFPSCRDKMTVYQYKNRAWTADNNSVFCNGVDLKAHPGFYNNQCPFMLIFTSDGSWTGLGADIFWRPV